MARVNIIDDSLFASALIGKTRAAVVPPITFAASRRVTISTVGRFCETPMAQMPYRRYMAPWIAVVS